MREAFQFSKTTVSMRFAELKPAYIGIHNAPKGRQDEIVATEWQVIYTKDGKDSVHLAFKTEEEADAAMDGIKAEADVGNPFCHKATFIEKEQDWQNEATRYWFEVDGGQYAVVESGPEVSIINERGDDVDDRDLEAKLRALLIVTDEMRAE